MARGNTVLSGAVDLSAANKGVIADNAFASSTLPTASPDLIGAALELTPEQIDAMWIAAVEL